MGSNQAEWLRFLARWALATVPIYLVVLIAGAVLTARPQALGADYAELEWAIGSPALFKLMMVADTAAWIMLGGIFGAFAAILWSRAPIRAALIAGCAFGQLFGSAGGVLRLLGTADLAARYTAVGSDQHAALLQTYLGLHLVIGDLQTFGGLFTKAGLLLVAWLAFSWTAFPRWLAIGFMVQGLWGVIFVTAPAVIGQPLNFLLFGAPYIFVWIAWGAALAIRFWRSAAPTGGALPQPLR